MFRRYANQVDHTGFDKRGKLFAEHYYWDRTLECLISHEKIDILGGSGMAMHTYCEITDQCVRDTQVRQPP